MIRKIALSLIIFIAFVGSSYAQNFEWVKFFAHGNTLTSGDIYDVSTDITGNIYVVGGIKGNTFFDPSFSNVNIDGGSYSDSYIAKLSPQGNVIWVKQNVGEASNVAYAVDIDNDFNIYVTGTFYDSIDLDPGPGTDIHFANNGTWDIYIQKLDSTGNLIWAKTIGSSNTINDYERGYDIVVDQNKNIYVVGVFSDSLDFDPGTDTFLVDNINTHDFFLLKLDSIGDFSWVHNFQAPNYYNYINIKRAIDGNLIFYGSYNITIDIDPDTSQYLLSTIGPADKSFIAKISPNKNLIWAKDIGGGGGLYINDMEQDGNGNLYCTGGFYSTNDFDPGSGMENLTSHGNMDPFILKLTSNGNYIWAKSWGDNMVDEAFDIKVDFYGNSYTSGVFRNTVDFDPGLGIWEVTSNGLNDNYYTKFDSSGNFVWLKTIGNSNNETQPISTVDNFGNIFCFGVFRDSIDFDDSPLIGDTSYLVGSTFGSFYIFKSSQDSCDYMTLKIDSTSNINCTNQGYGSATILPDSTGFNFYWSTSPTQFSSEALFTLPGIYLVNASNTNINCSFNRSILINGVYDPIGVDLNCNLICTNFRPGQLTTMWLNGFNERCAAVNGQLKIIIDSNINYISSNIQPDSIIGSNISWLFYNYTYDSLSLNPVLILETDSLLQIGDTVCFEVMINPIAGDADSSNNYKTYCFPVINGYDPNFKQVYPQGECIPNYVLNNEPLTYTIHFQNTGNADAINIHLLDTLDPNLDLNTLRVIGNSHDVITEILPGNVMNFRFDNIHLPDSGTNEIGSHGYVIYEVYPNTSIPNNTLIENTSYIYFDFNPAIITNTVFNTVVDVIPNCFLNVSENSNNFNFTIYPNPANDNITVFSNSNVNIGKIEILNLSGQIIQSISANSKSTTIDISSLSNGLYFIRVSAENGNSIYKFVKE